MEDDEATPLKASSRLFLQSDRWIPSQYETKQTTKSKIVQRTEESESAPTPTRSHRLFLQSDRWIPSPYEARQTKAAHRTQQPFSVPKRSLKRRLFLILTEPGTSIASAVFFVVLVLSITLMNVIMILQTMQHWQFTPDDCHSCGGSVFYTFDDDKVLTGAPVACVCPPSPVPWTGQVSQILVYFFTIEWILRLLTFEEVPENETQKQNHWWAWFQYLVSPTTILDALAIFPYYMEHYDNAKGLISLRLLRLFRVFQIVRLGQYNDTFVSMVAVLFKSVPYLKLLLGVLMFGAAFFGSMVYWVERGTWEYFEPTNQYEFVRVNNGTPEKSPFTSVFASFWWFIVTATTVGYGDIVPTSTVGKFIAICAMLMGVLVISFPVSVFTELWSKELRKTGALDLSSDDASQPEASAPTPRDYDAIETVIETEMTRNNSVSDDDGLVLMRRADLDDILASVQSIAESQRQIKQIIKKYSH